MTKRQGRPVLPKSERARKRYAEDAEYRQRTLANNRASIAARKAANPALYRLKQRARYYGLSLESYQAIMVRQGEACAICGTRHRGLCIDHCHATSKVRGLLCRNCNSGLGQYFDSPALLRAAAGYLKRRATGIVRRDHKRHLTRR
jgi:hypothetical protein